MNKTVLTSFTVSCLLSTVFLMGLAFNIHTVKACRTIIIRADGSIDPDTAPISSVDNITYTFTDSNYESIVVERSNIIINGNGYRLQGSGSGSGFSLSSVNNVTLANTHVEGFYFGVNLISTSDIILSGNNVTNNRYGVYLSDSSDSSISGNNVTKNGLGVELEYSSNNTVSRNNITANNMGIILFCSSNNTFNQNRINKNDGDGIMLYRSSNNVLRNNTMEANKYSNFGFSGSVEPIINLSGFLNDVDTSNTIEGKPIIYLTNKKNLTIDPQTYPNIGYLALINCTNITVHNLDMKNNNRQGILFAFTNSSSIQNVTTTNNEMGFWFVRSSNNNVAGNSIINSFVGIYVRGGSYNGIFRNRITNGTGIYIRDSTYANISNNTILGRGTTEGTSILNNGIMLTYSSRNNVYRNIIANSSKGIKLYSSSDNSLSKNTISNNTDGVALISSSYNNSIYGNTVQANSRYGIQFGTTSSEGGSSDNHITGNDIRHNHIGIYIVFSSHNLFFNNNFVENQQHASTSMSHTNIWDNGFEGNYWSNYTGVDSNHDGIGDSSYVIDENNTDNFPLMGMFSDFSATSEYNVQTICNSSISDFQFDIQERTISFKVDGEIGTVGFCRVMIPRSLMERPYVVMVDGELIDSTELPISNSTHAVLYFTYAHSTHEVIIIPELWHLYYDLLDKHTELLSKYNLLNQTCQEMLVNITGLQGKYDLLSNMISDMQDQIDDLQEQIDSLNSTQTSNQETIIKELGTIRNLMYIFIATTIILIATTLYFAIRKPKIKP